MRSSSRQTRTFSPTHNLDQLDCPGSVGTPDSDAGIGIGRRRRGRGKRRRRPAQAVNATPTSTNVLAPRDAESQGLAQIKNTSQHEGTQQLEDARIGAGRRRGRRGGHGRRRRRRARGGNATPAKASTVPVALPADAHSQGPAHAENKCPHDHATGGAEIRAGRRRGGRSRRRRRRRGRARNGTPTNTSMPVPTPGEEQSQNVFARPQESQTKGGVLQSRNVSAGEIPGISRASTSNARGEGPPKRKLGEGKPLMGLLIDLSDGPDNPFPPKGKAIIRFMRPYVLSIAGSGTVNRAKANLDRAFPALIPAKANLSSVPDPTLVNGSFSSQRCSFPSSQSSCNSSRVAPPRISHDFAAWCSARCDWSYAIAWHCFVPVLNDKVSGLTIKLN